jgi:hypothetical protein
MAGWSDRGTMTVKIFNGTVTEGDRVAYASSGYNKQPRINVGVVHEIIVKTNKYGTEVTKLKIRVELSNTWTGGDRWATVEHLERVVKL